MCRSGAKPVSEKMRIPSLLGLTLLIIVTLLTKCTAKSKLSLWIDEGQVETIIGYPVHLYIIHEGMVIQYLSDKEFEVSLPVLPPEIDTVNLTWEAGDELFTYWFDNLKSKNKTILYNPLLSIPASGIIPKGPKIFQMSIPCTGNDAGIAHLVLGLQIMDQHGKSIKGSPIKLKLKKQCYQFETTKLCKSPCQNNGRCNQVGECECTQGYHGQFCEIDMCNPKCANNGTCISLDMCLCLDGFFGKRCEQALCTKPCQNGGRCVQPGILQPGICWCTSGFFGEACEYSYCKQPCKHGGLCIDKDKCQCKAGYSGDRCEKGIDRQRRRVSKMRNNILKEERRKRKCERKRNELKKRCGKLKTCKSKHERFAKRCKSQPTKRRKRCRRSQAKSAKRCINKREKRRKRCQKKEEDIIKQCSHNGKRTKKKDNGKKVTTSTV